MVEMKEVSILTELIDEKINLINSLSKDLEVVNEEISKIEIEISSYSSLIDGDLDVFSPFSKSDDNRKILNDLKVKHADLLDKKTNILNSINALELKINRLEYVKDSFSTKTNMSVDGSFTDIIDSLELCRQIIFNDPYRVKLILDSIISKL